MVTVTHGSAAPGRALVLGGGGFIGSHLVKRLKQDGWWVRAADLKRPLFSASPSDEFIVGDLREPAFVREVLHEPFDQVYQLAADMGGAGFIFSGEHDADIMSNSALINLNVLAAASRARVGRIFYASSACVYPNYNQLSTANPRTAEASAYPAEPDSEYGWEKLFSERLYLSFRRNHRLDARIARFHNIFGPEGVFDGGREKAPAAMCRKVAAAADGGEIEIWGDGEQTRSFLYIDECVDGMLRLMRSSVAGPLNIGSSEMISINALAAMTMRIAGKQLSVRHVPGPLGVRGRTSDNTLIEEELGWTPTAPLEAGMAQTYRWVAQQLASRT